MDIAYVQHQVINEEMFYTLMATAFCLNVSVPLTIRWWKARAPSKLISTVNAE